MSKVSEGLMYTLHPKSVALNPEPEAAGARAALGGEVPGVHMVEEGVHLIVFVHGFQGNQYDLRMVREREREREIERASETETEREHASLSHSYSRMVEEGIHLIVFVHGFQGNQYNLRMVRVLSLSP